MRTLRFAPPGRFTAGFLLALTIAIHARGQDDAPRAGTTSSNERAASVRSSLRELEVAARHGDLPPEIDVKRYRDLTRQAHEFAKRVGGTDDRKYVQALRGAVEGGLSAELDLDKEDLQRYLRPMRARAEAQLMRMVQGGRSDPLERMLARSAMTRMDDGSAAVDAAAPTATAAAPRSSILQNASFIRNLRKLNDDSAQDGSDLVPADFFFRIVNGMTDVDNRFPYCVAVGGNAGYCCTGTLVGRNVVLTAGHCYPCIKSGTRVFVGGDINKPGKEYKGHAVRHKEYGKDGKHNDLCLVVLDDDVADGKPRKVAPAAVTDAAPYIRAVGYGTTDFAGAFGFGVRRYVDLPVVTTHCGLEGDGTHFGCDSGLEIVAGMVGLNVDTCKGDSGGPVFVFHDNDWQLVGATSRATSEATRVCGDGGVYVRVDKYVDWMRSVEGTRW